MKCQTCGTENPPDNRFCNSCGKLLPKPQVPASSIPSGAGQAPVPPASKGSGPGLLFLIGGLVVFIVIIGVGLVIVLPILEENPGDSSRSSIPQDRTTSGDSGQTVDPSASGVSGAIETPESSSFVVTATPGVSQPVLASTLPDDFIIGTWDVESTNLQMQFDANGGATLLDPVSRDYDTGSWEKIADGRYRLRSPSGTEYPVLLADPIAGTMYLEDHSLVFIRSG